MTDMLTRAKGWVSGVNTSNKNGLSILYDSIVHFKDHGDWTPLAYILGNAPKQYRAPCRLVCGQVLLGWTYSEESPKADKGREGKFKKQKNKNQGFDEVILGKLKTLVDKKATLLSTEVSEIFKAFKPEVTHTHEELLGMQAKRLKKWCEDQGIKMDELVQILTNK